MIIPNGIQWDESVGCMVDNFGIPLKLCYVRDLEKAVKIHLEKSAAEVANIANQVLQDSGTAPNGLWFTPKDME